MEVIPGKIYQAKSCDQLGASWQPLNAPITAGSAELTLSTNDPSSVSSRLYRVELVNP